jgi:hypothetical protein
MRLRIPMRIMRWILLALYIVLLATMVGLGWIGDRRTSQWAIAVMLASQAVFLFSAGVKERWGPLRRRRLILPVLIAAALMALLAGSLAIALGELVSEEGWMKWAFDLDHAFWVIAAISWLFWATFFLIYTRGPENRNAIRRLLAFILVGSLIELLATVPAHLVVSRKPGCFVGIYTSMGVMGGIYVMLWCFGPGILLLFFAPKRAHSGVLG